MTGRLEGILRRRLRPFLNKGYNVEEMVCHLRSTYPDYCRIKRQTLTTVVRKAMASFSASPRSNKGKEGDELSRREQSPPLRRDESSSVNLRRKKRKKFSEGDGDGDNHQEEGKDLSTSEDAIYEQKVEPEVDLSKSMLRERYKIASQERKVSREKNIEGETVTASKNNKKMDTINGGGDTKVEGKVKSLGSTPDDSTVTVHEESGPMFRDLGG
ncbi:hypothetical protein SAY86_029585 [Trapa natans]|uniref:Uncharacterized protein n=1 Tax=Trapa natans TaxID=22666 RepID=A0AAN7M2F5_TRANT|nr:hypothetical protein SAY86_029585 [Trapa natans]